MGDKFNKSNSFNRFPPNSMFMDDDGGEEENEKDYDALNDETFGDDFGGGDDWEEQHELYAKEQGHKDPENDANQALSMEVALNVLDTLDDSSKKSAVDESWQEGKRHNLPRRDITLLNGHLFPSYDPVTGQVSSSHGALEADRVAEPPAEKNDASAPVSSNQTEVAARPPVEMLNVQDLERGLFGLGVNQEPAPAQAQLIETYPEIAATVPISRDTPGIEEFMPHHLLNNCPIPNYFPRFPGSGYQRMQYTQNFGRMHNPQPPMRPPMMQMPIHRFPPPQNHMFQGGGPRFGPPPQNNWFLRGPYPRQNIPFNMNAQPPHPHPQQMHPMYFQDTNFRVATRKPYNKWKKKKPHKPKKPRRKQPYDEYTGLMTTQDRQWVANIQLMSLNGSNDDYYYMMFNKRHGNGLKKNQNQFKRDRLPPKQTPNYSPLQFENALGKLQVGSVNAPRKIIDMDVPDSTEGNTSQPMDKKNKKNLLDIEKNYDLLIKIEDAYNHRGHDKVPDPAVVKDLEENLETTLMKLPSLLNILVINKGKDLVLRFLRVMHNPDMLTNKILKDIALLQLKNVDKLLLMYLPFFRIYFRRVPFETMVEIVKSYDTSLLLSSKVMVSIMANLLEQAGSEIENPETNKISLEEWASFLKRLVESAVKLDGAELNKPVVAVSRSSLLKNLSLIKNCVPDSELTLLLNLMTR